MSITSVPPCDHLKQRRSAVSPKVWRVLTCVAQSLAQPITLRETASTVALHPDYLSRRFKQEMGIGFHDYVLGLRLRRATTLLVTSTRSIKEIGYDVGFHSPEVFSKAFKRCMGISPRLFRIRSLPCNGAPPSDDRTDKSVESIDLPARMGSTNPGFFTDSG